MQNRGFWIGVALIGTGLLDGAFDIFPQASTMEFLTAGVALIVGTKVT